MVTTLNTPTWIRSPAVGRVFRQTSPAFSGMKMVWESLGKGQVRGDKQGCKDVEL
uniref:Uncharacterized protein n=1 Tax=Nelumbo nucifera TaxID=4432 RepID=A0A822YXZ9_NELNU|nr:TPA_asm: hypothetical protein HUJ06_007022 [Nelumbo nucifera]